MQQSRFDQNYDFLGGAGTTTRLVIVDGQRCTATGVPRAWTDAELISAIRAQNAPKQDAIGAARERLRLRGAR